MAPIIRTEKLRKVYAVGKERVVALNNVDLSIEKGEFCCIVGQSGSGKSTLLNQLAGLEKPTSGKVYIGKHEISKMTENALAEFRQQHLGFIFQSYNLIPHQTVLSNVELALTLSGVSKTERRKRAVEALEMVGLGDQINKKPNQMSGGQMQRVAIARALVNNPAVILADEATGNLDTRTSFEILVLFQKLHAEGRTIIFVTHNPDIANYSSRNIMLRDGRVISDEYNDNIMSAAEGLAALPQNTDE